MILAILNMPHIKSSGFFKQAISTDQFWFVKREKYPEDIVNQVLEFFVEFVKEVLGEKLDDSSEDMSKSNTSRNLRSSSNQMSGRSSSIECPVLVILDNVQLMDEASWKLLESLREECQRIAFILLIQTDSNNKIKVHPEA